MAPMYALTLAEPVAVLIMMGIAHAIVQMVKKMSEKSVTGSWRVESGALPAVVPLNLSYRMKQRPKKALRACATLQDLWDEILSPAPT